MSSHDLPVFLDRAAVPAMAPALGRHTGRGRRNTARGHAAAASPVRKTTGAITIGAPPDAVWPWLVQVGCGRAGITAMTCWTTSAAPAPRPLWPACSSWNPASGCRFRQARRRTAQRSRLIPRARQVAALDQVGQHLGLAPDRDRRRRHPPGDPHPRRVRLAGDPPMALLGVLLMEFGDFAMLRRMLRGIK